MVDYQPEDYKTALARRLSLITELGTNQTRLFKEGLSRHRASLLPNATPDMWNPQLLPNAKQGGQNFVQFLRAISGQESGGNYNARNSSSGAMGKYQIMPGNIMGLHRGWDYEALGRDVSTEQFMRSPQIQEAIAQYKLRSYYQKWGPAGAAIAWYAGPGMVGRKLRRSRGYTGGYPSIQAYMQQVLGRM